MPWVWVCVMVFVGLAMVGHQFHGFVGHAVGFVWWVISWSCCGCGGSSISGHAVGVGCCGFYFCSCGLIFLGSCGLILGVGCVKWWLISGSGGLCEVVVNRWWWL